MHKYSKIFLYIILLVVTTLVISEIIARILHDKELPLYFSSKNMNLIYELNPSHPEINAFGMRDDELNVATLHNNFVIAVIGDSHAYSLASARRKNSFPARLEYHLAQVTGKPVTVLNFGVPGYNMHQELEVLRAKALKFKPDLIILQYCINDEHISNYIQPKHHWLNRVLSGSVLISNAWKTILYSDFGRKYIYDYLANHFPDLLLYEPGLVGTVSARRSGEKDPAHRGYHPTRSKAYVPVRYHDFIGREHLERDVKIFGKILKDAGIPAIATGFIEDKDRQLYEAAGLKVYSFFQIFEGLDMRDYSYNPKNTSDHFSDNGSNFIGKALANFIHADSTLANEPVAKVERAHAAEQETNQPE